MSLCYCQSNATLCSLSSNVVRVFYALVTSFYASGSPLLQLINLSNRFSLRVCSNCSCFCSLFIVLSRASSSACFLRNSAGYLGSLTMSRRLESFSYSLYRFLLCFSLFLNSSSRIRKSWSGGISRSWGFFFRSRNKK